MKIKMFFIPLATLLCLPLSAAQVPLELKGALYGISNLWGKAGGVKKYQSERSAIEERLKCYSDGAVVWREWRMDFLRFISDAFVVDYGWIREASAEILLSAFSGSTCQSTNCWMSAADYVHKVQSKQTACRAELDILEAENDGFTLPNTKSMKVLVDTRNRCVMLETASNPAFFAVTNVFPRWILPTLPPAEGAQLYTNVMRRAGLEPQRIEDLKPF